MSSARSWPQSDATGPTGDAVGAPALRSQFQHKLLVVQLERCGQFISRFHMSDANPHPAPPHRLRPVSSVRVRPGIERHDDRIHKQANKPSKITSRVHQSFGFGLHCHTIKWIHATPENGAGSLSDSRPVGLEVTRGEHLLGYGKIAQGHNLHGSTLVGR